MASSRLDLDTLFMMEALLMAERGTCLRAKVGAILTFDRRSISSGYVGSPPGMKHCLDVGCLMENEHCVRTVHAEANAIAYAARRGVSLMGATLYSTLHPCRACGHLAMSAGISRIVYLNDYTTGNWDWWQQTSITLERLDVKPHTHPFIGFERDRFCTFCGEAHWAHT